MQKLWSIILAMRPKTLSASLTPVWAGCLVTYRFSVTISWELAAYTLLSCLCIQIACNFFNDAIDHRKKADTPARMGPKRMTATGKIPRGTVMLLGGVALLCACGFAFPLWLARDWPILAIGLPCLLLAYCYTGGPYPLAYKGLGELFVILFFGLVAVCGTIFVQTGAETFDIALAGSTSGAKLPVTFLYPAGIVLGIQCGLLSAVMIAINNVRDRAEDETTGKRTLAVRWGDAKGRALALSMLIAAYITLPTSFRAMNLSLGNCWTIWLPPVLLAGFIIIKIRNTPANQQMNTLLALASIHIIFYLTAYTVSISWAIGG